MNEKNTIALLIIAIVFMLIYFISSNPIQDTEDISIKEEPTVKKIEIIEPSQDIIEKEEVEEQPSYKVDIVHNTFEPKELMVKKGSIVTWVNKDTKAHKIYHQAANKMFRSNVINPGYSFSYKFEEEGEYPYADAIFNYMQGKIIVEDSLVLITGNAIKEQVSKPSSISLILALLFLLITISTLAFKRTHILRSIHQK